MTIANFASTGLDKVAAWLERNNVNDIDELSLKQVLKTISISFILEGIDRVQSTLICELKDSYVQQSQRYVTMNTDSYRLPVLDENDNRKALEITERAFDLYRRMSQLKGAGFEGRPKAKNYLHGIPIEDARYILPLSTKTNVCVAMSGDKLVELFRLMNDKRYASVFSGIRTDISSYLPVGLIGLLPGEYESDSYQDAIQDFYSDDFSKVNTENNLVLLNHFEDLDMKVGFGALTSTLQATPSQEIVRWGQDAQNKARGIVERVLGYGHESIAEQARTTFGMMCSMVTYHQQLRHRLSQNYREDLCILIQDKERAVKVPESVKQSVFYQEYIDLVAEFKIFRLLVATKYGYDKAFSFMLNCDQIKLVISTNARIDILMLSDRTCMNAQWEIRELAIAKLKILRTLSKILYERALPSCVHGKCREGKLTCGEQAKVKQQFLVN